MWFFWYVGLLAFLINKLWFGYNENLLLCLIFILFYLLAYLTVRRILKKYITKKIYNFYLLILYTLNTNFFFYNLIIIMKLVRSCTLLKFLYNIKLINKSNLMCWNNLCSFYLTIIKFILVLNLNTNNKNDEAAAQNPEKQNDLQFIF